MKREEARNFVLRFFTEAQNTTDSYALQLAMLKDFSTKLVDPKVRLSPKVDHLIVNNWIEEAVRIVKLEISNSFAEGDVDRPRILDQTVGDLVNIKIEAGLLRATKLIEHTRMMNNSGIPFYAMWEVFQEWRAGECPKEAMIRIETAFQQNR